MNKKLIVKAIPKENAIPVTKSNTQILAEQGLKAFHFVWPIEIFSAWCNLSSNQKPNDRLLQLIKNDLQAHHV